jgi:hypothetical protein
MADSPGRLLATIGPYALLTFLSATAVVAEGLDGRPEPTLLDCGSVSVLGFAQWDNDEDPKYPRKTVVHKEYTTGGGDELVRCLVWGVLDMQAEVNVVVLSQVTLTYMPTWGLSYPELHAALSAEDVADALMSANFFMTAQLADHAFATQIFFDVEEAKSYRDNYFATLQDNLVGLYGKAGRALTEVAATPLDIPPIEEP